MFEHFLLAKSQDELLKLAKANGRQLSQSLQYDIGLACTSRLNRKTNADGVELASDGCRIVDCRTDGFNVNYESQFLLKIECLVEGRQQNYVRVLTLVEFLEDKDKKIRLSIGVANDDGDFVISEQIQSVERFQYLDGLQNDEPNWYLTEVLDGKKDKDGKI